LITCNIVETNHHHLEEFDCPLHPTEASPRTPLGNICLLDLLVNKSWICHRLTATCIWLTVTDWMDNLTVAYPGYSIMTGCGMDHDRLQRDVP